MKNNHRKWLLKKSTLTLFPVISLLAACNGGTSPSATPPPSVNRVVVVQAGALKVPLLPHSNVKKSANSAISLQSGNTEKFANPVIGYVFEVVTDSATEGLGDIASNGAQNLLNMMGISMFDSPEEANYHQIEDQLSDIQTSIDNLNQTLNQYVSMYELNVVNDYNENFAKVEGDIAAVYSNLAQDIYQSPNLNVSTQQAYITLWEDGIEPTFLAQDAALQNVKGISDLFYNFPNNLAVDIAAISDDSSDSYLKSDNVNLKIVQNFDGSWTTSGRSSPSSTPFAHGLDVIYNAFKNDHPMYGEPNASSQNLLLSKAEWTQIVMSELFKNMVSLQRTYRIIDFIVQAKFNANNSQFATLNLPSFMGNPSNYAIASNALIQIYRYKTNILYTEAMSAINRFQTGAPGSDISDFQLPSTCDDPIGAIGPGSASGQPMTLATFRTSPENYAWNGSNYTTVCSGNDKRTVTTRQDVVDSCGSGKLVNLNGHLYCDYKSATLKKNLDLQLGNLMQGDLSGASVFGLQPQNNPLDVRNIDGSSHLVTYSSSTAQNRLKFINDQLPSIHLRNYTAMNLYSNDPNDNYYATFVDLNHGTMYLFGQFKLPFGSIGLPFVYLQCLPHDLNCSVGENQANKTSWLTFADATGGTHTNLAITRPENVTNNQFSFDYTSH